MKSAAILAVVLCGLMACSQREELSRPQARMLLLLDSGWTFQSGLQETPLESGNGRASWVGVEPTRDVHDFLDKYPTPQTG